jgi:hypothetical protein
MFKLVCRVHWRRRILRLVLVVVGRRRVGSLLLRGPLAPVMGDRPSGNGSGNEPSTS